MGKFFRFCLAGLLLSGTAQSAESDNHLIGPLFLTPEQRDQLDASGHLNPDKPRQVAPGSIRFNGSVRRSSGRETAWMNGKRLGKLKLPEEVGTARLSGDKLLVENRGRTDILRAGESLSANDSLSRRREQ